MSVHEIEILKRALAREKLARKTAEDILETKSAELYELNLQNKQANEKLASLIKVKNSELKGFFENIIDAYIMMDLSGNVLKMNKAAEALLGYKLSEGILNLQSLTQEKDSDLVSASFQTLLQNGKITNFEVNLITQNNILKLVSINSSVIYDEHQKAIATHGILRDITQIKQLENQKEQLLHELEKSNENLQEYAHVVSHDLKSPLRSIDALVAWIQEDNKEHLKESSLAHFQLIEKTLEKMENLITKVLSYSSLGANMQRTENVDVDALLHRLLKVMYVPKHVQIQVLNTLPSLTGDEVKLEQLFQNLIGNAIKFNDKTQGIVKIAVVDKRDFYEFSVSDNGIGIEEKYFDTVFKIFNSLQKRKDSSGIGLSMVKKIVELHQGTIWIESELQKGTTFNFTLKK